MKTEEQRTARIPRATYRLQFGGQFRFADAAALVGYLEALGISDLYASPIFPTPEGSAHGYNVTAFDQPNPALGAQQDLTTLASELTRRGMGLLLDIVPNHMAADSANRWWWDVLQYGQASHYADHFDVRWEKHGGKVFLPVLGAPLDTILEKKEIRVAFESGNFVLRYFERAFPLSSDAYLLVLEGLRGELEKRKLASQLSVVQRLHRRLLHSPRALSHLGGDLDFKNDRAFDSAIADTLDRVNGNVDTLKALLELQRYQLGYWRDAASQINYRRFFDINDLAGLRMERAEVFDASHAQLLQWVRAGTVTGLRVDHPDGLRDPHGYLQDLQAAAGSSGGEPRALYLLVEKILTEGEPLRPEWPVHGTTGYDYLIPSNALFVQSANEEAFDNIYRSFTGRNEVFPEAEELGKEQALKKSFTGDLERLAADLKQIASSDCRLARLSDADWKCALTEFVCSLPVYRTYIDPNQPVSPIDAEIVQRAAATGLQRGHADAQALACIQDLFLQKIPSTPAIREFVWRFQQFSGPLTAKGVEDTAFYRYYRFASLNEVGGNPGRFGISPSEFHRWIERNALSWPHSMRATATHDTKRGEDLRARLNAISEFPDLWREHVQLWNALAASAKAQASGHEAPDANDEYLFYQTVVGAWGWNPEVPELTNRLSAYMLKAARERKEQTSWTDQNAAYERALESFVKRMMESHEFLRSVEKFVQQIARAGVVNSLAQTVLKSSVPGVPDFYQGSELWDFNLVDPDNRRPVDFNRRVQMLQHCAKRSMEDRRSYIDQLLNDPAAGEVKLFTTYHLLQARRDNAHLFSNGSYVPLEVQGTWGDRCVAFARVGPTGKLLVVVPRCATPVAKLNPWPIGDAWSDTTIALASVLEGEYQNVFTGEMLSAQANLALSAALKTFPVALFIAR